MSSDGVNDVVISVVSYVVVIVNIVAVMVVSLTMFGAGVIAVLVTVSVRILVVGGATGTIGVVAVVLGTVVASESLAESTS